MKHESSPDMVMLHQLSLSAEKRRNIESTGELLWLIFTLGYPCEVRSERSVSCIAPFMAVKAVYALIAKPDLWRRCRAVSGQLFANF